jgi:hypothetical protein
LNELREAVHQKRPGRMQNGVIMPPWQCDTTQPHRPNNSSSDVGWRCCSILQSLTWYPQTLISSGSSDGIYQGSSLWLIILLRWWHGYKHLTRFSLQRASIHCTGFLLGQVPQQKWWLCRKIILVSGCVQAVVSLW